MDKAGIGDTVTWRTANGEKQGTVARFVISYLIALPDGKHIILDPRGVTSVTHAGDEKKK